MLMQAYDFLVLNRKYGCGLECGGDDQWSNMLAGVDLIRRKEGKDAFAMTSALLTTSEGKKMGKTQKGAVWLDREKPRLTNSSSTGAISTTRTSKMPETPHRNRP